MAFKMKGMDHGEGTNSAFPNVGNTEYGPKSAAFQYDKFDVLKGKEHLEKIESSTTKKSTKTTKKKPTKTTTKKWGPITGKVGSELRRKQYDERGWKYDDTIKKVEKKNIAHKPTPQTITRKNINTDYDPNKRNKKTEGYIPQSQRK